MRPIAIPKEILTLLNFSATTEEYIQQVKANYSLLRKERAPDVTVIIPIGNEAQSMLQTLYSLVLNETRRAVEIIVVNNHSHDDVEELIKATGITCIREAKKGLSAARFAALSRATGKFILNADAGVIYPSHWIQAMIIPLVKKSVAVSYGGYAFIPVNSKVRFPYYLYERVSDVFRYLRCFRKEAKKVYAFTFGYRRLEGLQIAGYDGSLDTNEEGYLVSMLKEKGFGKLHCVSQNAVVWLRRRHSKYITEVSLFYKLKRFFSAKNSHMQLQVCR